MGDRRLGEAWTPLQRLKNDVLWGTASTALWAARRMSDETRRRAGRLLGRAAAGVLPAHRARAGHRLAAAYGGVAPVRPVEVFETLGEDLAQTLSLLRSSRPVSEAMPLSAEARQVLDEAVARGRGVVFATAHLGPLDLMAACVAEAGYRIATLARESYDPRFTEMYDALRKPRGVRTIYRGRAGMETAVVRALRGGALVGFPMDLAGRGMQTRELPFLGERSPIPVGPARIAEALGAPVVVGTFAPGGSGMHFTVQLVGLGGDLPEAELTASITRALERRILDLPAHWPWMHGA